MSFTRFLLAVVLLLPVSLNAAVGSTNVFKVPNISLGGQTNVVTDNGTALTYNGVALGSGSSAAQVTLTHAGTMTLAMTNIAIQANLTTLTGNVTFATSNLTNGNSYIIYGRNTQVTNCTPTFPSWRWMAGAPTTITASKEFTLSLSARGTVDTNVWAAYAEAP